MAMAAFASATGSAAAQALTPMRGEVRSFTDQFAVRVFPANPYGHRIRIDVHVYDETFAPVQEAQVLPPSATLAPGDSRSVYIVVPFEGHSERKVRICAESVPFGHAATLLRTQVCGRFLATRVQ